MAFNKNDLSNLQKLLNDEGADSETNATLPSILIPKLTLPDDKDLAIWLATLKYPGLKSDLDLLNPKGVFWNHMLLIWSVAISSVSEQIGREVKGPAKGFAVAKPAVKKSVKKKAAKKSAKKKVSKKTTTKTTTAKTTTAKKTTAKKTTAKKTVKKGTARKTAKKSTSKKSTSKKSTAKKSSAKKSTATKKKVAKKK